MFTFVEVAMKMFYCLNTVRIIVCLRVFHHHTPVCAH